MERYGSAPGRPIPNSEATLFDTPLKLDRIPMLRWTRFCGSLGLLLKQAAGHSLRVRNLLSQLKLNPRRHVKLHGMIAQFYILLEIIHWYRTLSTRLGANPIMRVEISCSIHFVRGRRIVQRVSRQCSARSTFIFE